ncbi:hypothetical protein Pla52o_21130 [Novipirellula galeiformis]|uniref:Uncharacterized protein n=1 Tax=Novipirellula galeiformis TaxID=2528004 RepID=A0A5C6CN19_9BACT|nr:hypothetical protein Pla52o_21130 [Novipirellula galeiformis]
MGAQERRKPLAIRVESLPRGPSKVAPRKKTGAAMKNRRPCGLANPSRGQSIKEPVTKGPVSEPTERAVRTSVR